MIYNKKELSHLIYARYLINIIPGFIKEIKFKNDQCSLFVIPKNIFYVITFLKKHFNSRFDVLVSIHCIDYIKNKNRFEVNYNLLSLFFNYRIVIKTHVNELTTLNSITSIFKGASWYEREVWDMFGVFFTQHPDLRRILTDYGFEGFPFRKDFPQTGFLELRYDDELKYIVYEPLELAQEYRFFEFNSPWMQVK